MIEVTNYCNKILQKKQKIWNKYEKKFYKEIQWEILQKKNNFLTKMYEKINQKYYKKYFKIILLRYKIQNILLQYFMSIILSF